VRIVFSRKGFDGTAGGCPSPILAGRPVSLPIPTSRRSHTRFAELGLGELVERLTRGRIPGSALCPADPDLLRGAFGQTGAAQSHLERSGVGEGDVFLFFGLFRELDPTASKPRFDPRERPHHRLFGWLAIGRIVRLGEDGGWARDEFPELARHPHLGPGWNANNTLYLAAPELRLEGAGGVLPGFGVARRASTRLRLTAPGASASLWSVPDWLNPLSGGVGMSYHGGCERWSPGRCRIVSRGQEFVSDVGERADARAWLVSIIAAMSAG
jgi:hypothetical protein